MASPRSLVFPLFEELLSAGWRPVMTGFKGDGKSEYWPEGSEGFFIAVKIGSEDERGFLLGGFAELEEIASRHDMKAWFSTCVRDEFEQSSDPECYTMQVTFETRLPWHGGHGDYTREAE